MLQKNGLDAIVRALYGDESLAAYYNSYKALLVAGLEGIGRNGIMLDLELLPGEPYHFKKLFLMWLMAVNKPRIENGEQPIVTFELVMQCPLWKFIAPPFRRISMTRDGINGAQTAKTVNQQRPARGINRSRRR